MIGTFDVTVKAFGFNLNFPRSYMRCSSPLMASFSLLSNDDEEIVLASSAVLMLKFKVSINVSTKASMHKRDYIEP